MRIITIFTITATILFSAYAMGWPQTGEGIQLKATAEVEVKTLDAKGRTIVTRVPADKVTPGTLVIYTIYCSNGADQPAERVVITNPIPKHMRYQDQSAFGPDAAITFSIDGGQTFEKPDKLHVVDPTGRSFPASPADFTHVRWVLEQALAPRATGQVGFRAVLE